MNSSSNIKTWAPDFDVEYIMIDSIAFRRRKSAMGAKGGSQSIGRIAGGSATKIHLVFDSRIKPLEYIQKGAIHFDERRQTCCNDQFLCDVVLFGRFVETLGLSRKREKNVCSKHEVVSIMNYQLLDYHEILNEKEWESMREV